MIKTAVRSRQVDVAHESDVWLAISYAADAAQEMGLREADRVRIETVTSEMARNVLVHGGGGTIAIEPVIADGRSGLRICAQDSGPGIADVSRALEDGFTTGNSLGIGLGVTKRMMDDVAIHSHPGWGTTVTVTMWLDKEHEVRRS
jgi:serine/threonine-protein kinase RsbT